MFIFGIGCVCVAGGEVEREGAILLKQFVYQSKWTRISLKQGASDFSLHQNHLEDLLKHLGFLIQWVWSGSQEFVFLICSQVTLMLLVQGLYFENQCSTLGDMLHGWNYQVFSHMNDRSQVRAEGEMWPGQSQGSLRAMRPPACAWRGSTGKTKHGHVHWIQWPPHCWAGPNQSPAASPPPGLGCVRGSGRETFSEPASKCRPNTFF